MKRNTKIAAAIGVAAVVAVGAVAVLEQKPSGAADHDRSIGGIVAADPSVHQALTDNQCPYLTEPASPGARHTVVVMSRTGLMASAGLPTGVLRELSETAGGAGDPVGALTLVTVGGDGEAPPTVLDGAALTDPSAGSARRERLLNRLGECVDVALDAAPTPGTEGSDELRAQQAAARIAQAAKRAGTDTRVVVISDGEANAGSLDLREQNFPAGDPAAVASRVAAANELPTFGGLPVSYYGIGQNQTQAGRSWLTSFYTSLCEAAGGDCSVLDDHVPVAEDVPARIPADPPLAPVSPVAGVASTTFRVDSAAFRPDTTDLVDPASVRSALRKVASDITRRSTRQVLVVGHACDDSGSRAGQERIAWSRAETVGALLAQMPGVDPGRINTVGRGVSEPLAGPEPDGRYTQAQCAANRRVEIILR